MPSFSILDQKSFIFLCLFLSLHLVRLEFCFVLARMMQWSFSYQAARVLGNPGSLPNFRYLKFFFTEPGHVCMWQVQFGS